MDRGNRASADAALIFGPYKCYFSHDLMICSQNNVIIEKEMIWKKPKIISIVDLVMNPKEPQYCLWGTLFVTGSWYTAEDC